MDDTAARAGPGRAAGLHLARLARLTHVARLAASAGLLAALAGCALPPAASGSGPSAGPVARPAELRGLLPPAATGAGLAAGPVRAPVAASAAPAAAALPPGVALERLLGELRPLLPTELRPGLEQAQRRWQLYAETDCRWQRGLSDGGSASALVYGQCMKNRAAQRVGDLKLLLCEGFGLTGPCEASARYDQLAD